jgi:hypothetical protein
MHIIQAINELAPDARWSMEDYDYDNIDWKSPEIPIPTMEEIEVKIQEIIEREEQFLLEKPMRLLREHRNQLLTETDWWAVTDRTMTQAQIDYRQSLRDLPSISNPVLDPNNIIGISGVVWPVKPE